MTHATNGRAGTDTVSIITNTPHTTEFCSVERELIARALLESHHHRASRAGPAGVLVCVCHVKAAAVVMRYANGKHHHHDHCSRCRVLFTYTRCWRPPRAHTHTHTSPPPHRPAALISFHFVMILFSLSSAHIHSHRTSPQSVPCSQHCRLHRMPTHAIPYSATAGLGAYKQARNHHTSSATRSDECDAVHNKPRARVEVNNTRKII